MSSDRQAAIVDFVRRAGWGDAQRRPLAGDASSRRYERLSLDGRTAVLMDAPPAAEAPACPPGASEAERAALGYNALARLAGPNTTAFVGLARELTARGFSAPRVLAADMEQGLVLLEDLGDALFARALDEGASPAELYGAATDALAAVRRSTLPDAVEVEGRTWPLQAYDRTALQAEADLFIDWYAAHRGDGAPPPAARAAWREAWGEAFSALDAEAPALSLRDVHAENLIWLPEREGPARAGLIDFQDAVFGHPAYDLVSLLQDARRDVEPALADAMIARYATAAGVDDEARFRRAYAVLGAQRHAKVLGIFVRLDKRDGKPLYLKHLPRVARLFVEDLDAPDLVAVKSWVARFAPTVLEEAQR